MIRVIDKANFATNAHYIAAFAALRHRVFVERLGWTVNDAPVAKGFEYDRYDTSDATYMVICNADDEVVAGLRMLKTTQPFLLAQCFPELDDGTLPQSETVWEVTRFVVDPCPIRTAGCKDLGTQLVWGLQSYGLMRGLTSFVSVSYAGMERLLRNAGCRFRRLGAPRRSDGRVVVPLEFEISDQVLAAVEQRLPTMAETAPEPHQAVGIAHLARASARPTLMA